MRETEPPVPLYLRFKCECFSCVGNWRLNLLIVFLFHLADRDRLVLLKSLSQRYVKSRQGISHVISL